MAEKIYFHKLKKKEKRAIMESKMNVGEFMEKYAQPDWCTYPDALGGTMGCWSLLLTDIKISKKSCKKCDLYKPEAKTHER